jgi:hypothetical protein
MKTVMGFFLAVVLATMGGCATGHKAMRGDVVMKMNDGTAHVCLGKDEVQVGDQVRLLRKECTQGPKRQVCTKVPVADGTVTALLDDHYSEVTFPAGTVFTEGDTVEPVAR